MKLHENPKVVMVMHNLMHWKDLETCTEWNLVWHHCIFSLYHFQYFLYTPSTLNLQP